MRVLLAILVVCAALFASVQAGATLTDAQLVQKLCASKSNLSVIAKPYCGKTITATQAKMIRTNFATLCQSKGQSNVAECTALGYKPPAPVTKATKKPVYAKTQVTARPDFAAENKAKTGTFAEPVKKVRPGQKTQA
jgi:hypothetical protein